jgi:FlaA1/EpsC-like NDP-sugar epimerase
MRRLLKGWKRLGLVLCDLCAVVTANVLAVALRFDFDLGPYSSGAYRHLEFLGIELLLTPVIFGLTGLYQGYWKYAGLSDLARIIRAVAARTVGVISAFYLAGFAGLSRGVLIIDAGLLMLFVGALRLAPRFRFEITSARKSRGSARALIVGAGDTGESLLREIRKSPHLEYNLVGFVDDDADKLGLKIHGVAVLGNTQRLERLIETHGVREVIIAIPSASLETRRAIFEACRRTGARFKTIPTRGEMQRGATRISQIRPVDLEDLLGRETISLDQETLRRAFQARTVLITGAAGSIGREMARQVAADRPARLILVDRNENNLFYLESELREAQGEVNLEIVVADVMDRLRMETVFKRFRPEIVFHAAAYKHVPLMEFNPGEAVKNNILGTLHLVEICESNGVERFIFVSTDKAVRPTSVMGASKRLGERLVKSFRGARTRCMAVRFGNVLGSDGSVIPTFRRQIASGGPVTVTHPEATRYFMTIPEAVQLVLTAGAMGEGGETFLLQMGIPVRIVDLARNMIELSGFRVDDEIKIVYTGLRPGEKLHEELKAEHEEARPTTNDKILILTGVEPLGESDWLLVKELESLVDAGQPEPLIEALCRLVPDFSPTNLPVGSPATRTPSKIVDFGSRTA